MFIPLILSAGHYARIATTEPSQQGDDNQFCGNECRSVPDIVWSCLATIFACTWIAIHPNIPPQEGVVGSTITRVQILVVALLTPELIILWASRQWFAARAMAKEYEDCGWTTTHAFFALMGGFKLYVDGKPHGTILAFDLGPYIRAGQIDITEDEIQDKSKGDVLAKGFVLLQTAWFILQLFARFAKRLPVTELELATLAFAILNFVIYFFWWNKPLNLNCPVRMHVPELHPPTLYARGSTNTLHLSMDVPESFFSGSSAEIPLSSMSPPTDIQDESRFTPSPVPSPLPSDPVIGHPSRWSFFRPKLRHISSFIVMFSKLIFHYNNEDRHHSTRGVDTVPMYYYGRLTSSEKLSVSMMASVIGVIFGGTHCVAWHFQFPSDAEENLWRVSAAIITCVPVYAFLLYAGRKWSRRALYHRASTIVLITTVGILYSLARLTLLVEMFVLLRSPSPGIYRTVPWTSFIPHI
ncbi:hypothetical protein Hypma_004323 [Hypsizygus marmoreus]|uniref:Uncharacterized protein n=1 Tax=Hypsizygus marmoreus TaxID=39966 RepID=A0A369JYC9_HYPMA|nr:hypothetical protein Hypma_004323 [Hypsizygus marmoreus]